MKVSVIIPTYKRSEDIQRAVDSVLTQSITDIEIIVIDDNGIGSIDGLLTAEKMQKYKKEPRVKYIQHIENRNGSAARNTGIKAASGKYISFLDDDDIYLPQRLERMSNKLDALDDTWGACYSSYVKKMSNGKVRYSKEIMSGNIFLQALMRSFYLGSGSNMFFRREVIENIGLFDETFRRNQDLEYLVRVLKKYKMAYIDNVLMEVNIDKRTNILSFHQQVERERQFRNKFSSHLNDLSENERRSVVTMWNIDWIRLCIESKQYVQAIKEIYKSRIPIKVFWAYIKYIIDRAYNKTSYGFVVKI